MKITIPYTPEHGRESPNIFSMSNDAANQIYLRTIVVSFFTLRKYNPKAELIFTTSILPGPIYVEIFNRLEVKINLIEFNHRPPDGYCRKFRGSFYKIDAILAQTEGDHLYLDPDVICLKPLNNIFNSSPRLEAYPIATDVNQDVNGLTFLSNQKITEEIFRNQTDRSPVNTFYGGEFIFIPKELLSKFQDTIEILYQESITRFNTGGLYYPTEEHIFTAALSSFQVNNASVHIKRVWTSIKYRNVTKIKNEIDLSLIHLPSEKDFGFQRTYSLLKKDFSKYLEMSDSQFKHFVSKNFQIDRPLFKVFILRLLRKFKVNVHFEH
jgi:hypothetical protein